MLMMVQTKKVLDLLASLQVPKYTTTKRVNPNEIDILLSSKYQIEIIFE